MNVVRIEDEESSSSSSMSLYNIEFDGKDSEVSSRKTPTLLESQVPDKPEEVHNSQTIDKNHSKRHSQVQQEEEIHQVITLMRYLKPLPSICIKRR